MKRLSLLFLVAFLGVGCSPRDHENLLDPENPDTGGRPQWLSVLADDGAVDLSWSVPAFVDLDAIHLVDAGSGEVLRVAGSGPGVYRHQPLANGEERSYRLVLVLNDGDRIELPAAAGTPGPDVPWIYDAGRGEAVRLTPDGLRRRDGFPDGATLSVVADPDSGFALAVDFFAGRVILLDRSARERWRNEDFERPNAASPAAGGWWITDSELARAVRLDEGGVEAAGNDDFIFPIDVIPAPEGGAWVGDDTGPVVRLSASGVAVAADTLGRPRVLAPAPDGGVWVADRNAEALVRLDVQAVEILRVPGFPRVDALAFDPPTGGVWVSDRERGRVVLVDSEGATSVVLPGFPAAVGLALSPDGGRLWIADAVRGEVVRVARDGAVLSRSEGLSTPVSLSVAFRAAP